MPLPAPVMMVTGLSMRTPSKPCLSNLRPCLSNLRPCLSNLRPCLSNLRPCLSNLRPCLSNLARLDAHAYTPSKRMMSL